MEKSTTGEYLKSILKLQRRNGYARSVDVAKELGVTRPSVCAATKSLREENMICLDDNGFILLTETGKAIAEKVCRKQTLLMKVLLALGVNERNAAVDANLMEQVISDETYDRLEVFFRAHLEPEVFE